MLAKADFRNQCSFAVFRLLALSRLGEICSSENLTPLRDCETGGLKSASAVQADLHAGTSREENSVLHRGASRFELANVNLLEPVFADLQPGCVSHQASLA